MEYREQFEMLMAPLKKSERAMLESIFLNGLRDEIQAELKLHNIRGLNSLMDRALLIEERNKALKDDKERRNDGSKWKSSSSGSGYDTNRNRTFITKPKLSGGANHGISSDGKSSGNTEAKKQGTRRDLSQEELKELSRKGLCFKCGERWGRDHICKMKHYRIELVECEEEEELEEEDEREPVDEVGVTSSEVAVEFKKLRISLRSSQGLTSNQSFKVWGLINGRWVLILIDSGASTNFISYKLVQELKLQLQDTDEYTIEMGNGERLVHKEVCGGLRVEIQGITFAQNFFLMSLAGTEMVLGMDWLASLGDIKANFKNLEIKWKSEGQKLKIKGEAGLSKHQTSLKTMYKSLQQEDEYFVVHLYQLQKHGNNERDEQLVNKLLQEYADVFKEPTGLPPHRE